MPVTQVVPFFPPTTSGVGDYANIFAHEAKRIGIALRTVVANRELCHSSDDAVVPLKSYNAEELAECIERTASASVLLHFSGYGYGKRGLCEWLVNGLRLWKRRVAGRRLVTIFHEVYATGPIWRSSFWTEKPQRRIAKSLAGLSDSAFVTSEGGYEQLKPLHPELQLEILPVFSNVGELEVPIPLVQRDAIAVIFGGSACKRRLYNCLASLRGEIALGFDRIGIIEVLDVGPPEVAPKNLGGRPVRPLGTLPAAQVSEILARARIGLLDYPQRFLTKSGIAAAYLAHGMLVVNTASSAERSQDILEGKHFIYLRRLADSSINSQQIAAHGHAWYRRHRVSDTVQTVMGRLG